MSDIAWDAKSLPFENTLVYCEDIHIKRKISFSSLFEEVIWRPREQNFLIIFKNILETFWGKLFEFFYLSIK